ncbi:MAG TPA: hypothetical protein VEL07_19260 [Planctomycetota bacterium]|nr:hypothetical protein [Planctomycetota bacterium]
MADTAKEPVDQDDADIGAPVEQQTPGDSPDARQPGDGDKPETGSDDSDATSDPLLLAQLEPETPAETPAPTTPPTTQQQPAKQDGAQQPEKPGDTPKPTEPAKAEDDSDVRDALADLPAEDWQKLQHKTKSTFLSQRKVIRTQDERLKAEAKARKEAEERYGTVEQFIRENGLGDEECATAIQLGGLMKRNDARVIPQLEQALERLRKANGQAVTPPTPPPAAAQAAIDADLAAVLKEAEEYGIDTSKVRARSTAAPAPAPAPAAAPAPAPAPAAQAHQAQPGDSENVAIIEALQGLGVANVVGHLGQLMAANPALRDVPPGQRLRAVVAAHNASASRPAPQTRPTGQPLSGRGRPSTAARGTTATTADPLKLAMKPAPGR